VVYADITSTRVKQLYHQKNTHVTCLDIHYKNKALPLKKIKDIATVLGLGINFPL